MFAVDFYQGWVTGPNDARFDLTFARLSFSLQIILTSMRYCWSDIVNVPLQHLLNARILYKVQNTCNVINMLILFYNFTNDI